MAEAQEEQHRSVMQVLRYQFSATIARPQAFSMPVASSFLDLQVQSGGIPVMWWLCAVDGVEVEYRIRNFVTLPTGPPGTDVPLYYVGTYQLDGDTFAGHVFCTEPFNRKE